MKKLPSWVKLPTGWIESGGLNAFRWARGEGADQLAALMGLAVISHHIDGDSGTARLTYDDLCVKTALSRAKLSAGLGILTGRRLIEREGRSTYHLANFDPTRGWAKFPAQGLYHNGTVAAFDDFRLRLPAELDALKLYFLLASRRDRKTNLVTITYDKIVYYSGIPRNNIRRAITLLSAHGLVHIERFSSDISDHGFASSYRLVHLDTSNHMGTTGRGMDIDEYDPF